MLTRRLSKRCDGERGSIPIALLALMLVSTIVGIVVATVVSGERQTRFDSNYEAALQTAEIGVAEFISSLKNPGTGLTQPCSPTPPNVEAKCITVQTVAGGAYQVRGEKDTTGSWTIDASATMTGNVRRVVRVRLQTQQPFKYALFGDKNVQFTGTARMTSSFNSKTGRWGGGGGTGNGAVAGNYGGNVNGVYDSWDPAANIDIASDDAVAFITDEIEKCKAAGTFPATLPDPIPPGTYCVDQLSLNGVRQLTAAASITTPVKIYVTGNIAIGRNARVNCGTSSEKCTWGSTSPNLPNPAALQIYSIGQGQVTFDHSARIAAAIYAPRSHCSSMPHVQIFGSLVCRSAGVFTGHFRLYYDDLLKEVQGAERRIWSEEPIA